MFCQNCGKEINTKDTFCGVCGTKVVLGEEKSKYVQGNEHSNGQIPNYVSQHRKFSETVFGKLVLNYFKKPLSIFSLMKEEDTVKTSVGLLIGMPILYGFFHMLYFISFFKVIINNLTYYITNSLNTLSSSLANTFGLNYSTSDLLGISDEIAKVKEKVQAYISLNMKSSDYFFKGIFIMFLLILITFVVIEICNSVILNNSISQKNVIFIVTVGFAPLIIALILNNVIIYISFVATLCIYVFGFIMSLITIFSGIMQLSGESRERGYFTMCVNNLVLIIAMLFIINIGFSSVCETVINIFQVVSKYL